ncbi:MAG: PaaI family thioesterase, partial [Betaproteobacteria bacterium]
MNFAVDIPFVRLLGFDLQLFEAGHAQIDYAPQSDHRNAAGAIHGGVLMTLLDVTMASAARSVQPASGLVTIEMKTSFMQAGKGRLTSKGKLVHRSTSLAFTEATIVDETG